MAETQVQSFRSYFSWLDVTSSSGSDPTDVGFHWADYLVFAATLLIALGIGVFQAFTGDRQKTTKEYLMGNRSVKKLL